MSEEEKAELEVEKAKEEKRNVAKQMATSFPKFLVNGLIVIGLGLFYLFIIPFFVLLDQYPLLILETFVLPNIIVLTGYSLLRIGVLLVILLFGIEAIMQLARSVDALVEYLMSRLPGMRSTDRHHPRRIPLDLIYIFFALVVYIIISPIFLPGQFPIDVLQPYFQLLAVSIVLFFVLTFIYDLAKSIQKSSKRGIDNFGKRIGGRFEDDLEQDKTEPEY
ncbi:MAG: hypothetical protein ACFFD8_08630 [Candidatus Thorarchaeota archaeon]